TATVARLVWNSAKGVREGAPLFGSDGVFPRGKIILGQDSEQGEGQSQAAVHRFHEPSTGGSVLAIAHKRSAFGRGRGRGPSGLASHTEAGSRQFYVLRRSPAQHCQQ